MIGESLRLGDVVNVVNTDYHGGAPGEGLITRFREITCERNHSNEPAVMFYYRMKDGSEWYTCAHAIQIKNNKTMANLKEKFNSLFLKEPQKSFRAVGVTDDSDKLTEEGKAVFLAWLFAKNVDDFKVEVVDKILDAENPSTTGKTA